METRGETVVHYRNGPPGGRFGQQQQPRPPQVRRHGPRGGPKCPPRDLAPLDNLMSFTGFFHRVNAQSVVG